MSFPRAMERIDMVNILVDREPTGAVQQAARRRYIGMSNAELAKLVGPEALVNVCPKPTRYGSRSHYWSDDGRCLNCGQEA